MDSKRYIGVAAESTFLPTSRFVQLYNDLKPHLLSLCHSSHTDKFIVLSFLETLEDSVYGTLEYEELRQEYKDLTSQSCNQNRSARSGSRR